MKTISRIVQELLPAYLTARKHELPIMTDLLDASDFEQLRILGHNLKGSGRSFGLAELSRIGAALEHSAEQADPVSFTHELTRLRDYLDHAGSSQQPDEQQPDEGVA
ncbi:MAG: Hpt domain-containing protein [Acidobacteriaceae bacterium]|nr:Hpt domain-containing protein [Acidobacteriaceae bacterium]MBV9765457.1 Hpt domain-containing protein [Acidobacteriaceae bacterium]